MANLPTNMANTVNQTFNEAEADSLATLVVPHLTESKAGFRTTEFWVAVAVALTTVSGAVPLPEKAEGVVLGAIAIAYAISRGLAKQGVPAVVEA